MNDRSDGANGSGELRLPNQSRLPLLPTTARVPEPVDRDPGLRDYWNMVRKRVWLIVTIVAVVTLPVTYLMLQTPDYYDVKARIELNIDRPPAGDEGSPLTYAAHDPAFFNTQLQLMNSPGLLRRVVRTLNLEADPVFTSQVSKGGRLLKRLLRLGYLGKNTPVVTADAQPPLTPALKPSISAQDLAETQRLAPFVADIQKRLTIEPVMETRALFKETRLVDLKLRHANPQMAARLVNAVADAFIATSAEKGAGRSASANEYLTRRTMELQAQIREAEDRLISFAKRHDILSLQPGQNPGMDRLMNLNRQALEAENESKLAEANYTEAQSPGASAALSEESARNAVNTAEVKLAELRVQRAQLLVGATEKWPEVKEVNQQILALENQIRDIRKQAAAATLALLETRYQQALAHERAVRTEFTTQRSLMQVQNEAAVEYRLIEQEIDTKKNLLNLTLKRLGENDIAQAATASTFRVLEYATPPDVQEPAGPLRLLFIVAAFALSLLVGVAIAFVREIFDETMRSNDDVQAILRLPVLGAIRTVGRRRMLASPIGIGLNGARDSRPVVLIGGSDSAGLAEDYRQLRTEILLSTPGESPRTVLVTSSGASDGRTTAAINISTSLAQTGARVLLVDADMRNPAVHTMLNIDNSRGLSTILSSPVAEEDLLDAITMDRETGVYILPAGPLPPNPAELLGSEEMRKLLAILCSRFRYIVVDSPPITSWTDSVVLSPMVDGVLLVVHASRSSREVVRNCQQLLIRVGAKLLGAVLMNVERTSVKAMDRQHGVTTPKFARRAGA